LKPDNVLLEIGTGLGYQAAVLAELADRVYSVEIKTERPRLAHPETGKANTKCCTR
jgi:protein-L-isoaspartate O-methyltransferase